MHAYYSLDLMTNQLLQIVPNRGRERTAVGPGTEVDSAPEDTDQKTSVRNSSPPSDVLARSYSILSTEHFFPAAFCDLDAPLVKLHLSQSFRLSYRRYLLAVSPSNLDDPSVQASWWLELRTEALTHMRHVNCNALVGYREDCAIFEDVCVLSCYATAVHLNPYWVHRPSEAD
ncbi:unnamed protein product, partial [Dibothriocephalus latus]